VLGVLKVQKVPEVLVLRVQTVPEVLVLRVQKVPEVLVLKVLTVLEVLVLRVLKVPEALVLRVLQRVLNAIEVNAMFSFRFEWRSAVLPAVVVLVLLASAVPVAAQPEQPPPAGAQEEFVPVKDLPHQEQLPGGPLVLAAYGFVWAVLLVYVWTIWRRLGKVEREMRALAGRLKGQQRGIEDRM